MKGFCLLAVVVAFLMFYQKEPVYAIVIIGVGIGIYLFYKAKKSGRGKLGIFFNRNQSSQEKNFDDLVTLIILQQLLSNSSQDHNSKVSSKEDQENQAHHTEIDKIQQEILDLLKDN